ncbi:hypothetical protein ABBQ38_006474 [Trebouxia sp. C0009 RCD-2024]
MLMIWETNFFLATAFFIGFGFIDMVFTTANLNKVPLGGWFALAIAGSVFILSYLWWWGTSTKLKGVVAAQVKMQDLLTFGPTNPKKDDAISPDDVIPVTLTGARPSNSSPTSEDKDGITSPKQDAGSSRAPAAPGPNDQLMLAATGQPVLRIPAVGLMFADTLYGAPSLLPELVNRWGAVHRVLIILTILPRKPATRLRVSWLHLVVVMSPPLQLDAQIYLQLTTQQPVTVKLEVKSKGLLPDKCYNAPDIANTVNTSYIVSFTKLFARPEATGLQAAARRFFLENVYASMGRFARKSWEDWCIPHGSLFEIGVALDV